MKKKIILVSGDPNSINSEIIYKCWKKIPKNLKNKIILLSNYNLIQQENIVMEKKNALSVKV